jgi:endogenous inhibitor of DNA gyrase (YacG/DUF329 family)
MASQKKPQSRDDAASALVHVPCPACGRGVQLSAENRLANGDDVYECPTCDARLVVSDSPKPS